ncbi:hypothetical protein QKC54_gp0457 [Megavirus baoshan]|uniref:Minor capsid protein P8 central region domain-containing protein n=1 Tax=Megavirus baoshan TaxID=2496520 RepID=A0A3S8UX87_9VIRU|nr:hypothetical protein QKC54_gp0457 [Megavirus baoshan]AZL89371.1 hypothetical protein Mb0615 [Megavirus baoshan]
MSLPKGALNKKNIDVVKTPFLMFQCNPQDYQKMTSNTNLENQIENKISKLFFSPKNIDLIQKQIIYNVFQETNGEYLIEKQNEADLVVVMRSIYYQYCKHLPDNVTGQILQLNNLVVDEVTPDIVSEIKAHFGYLDRAFGKFEPMDRPQNVSNTGTKTLPSITNIY